MRSLADFDLTFAAIARSEVFQCQLSSEQKLYTPNIPDSYFNHQTLQQNVNSIGEAQSGVTYIFTTPPRSQARNCSGTVMAIQHCYHADLTNGEIGRDKDIFEFLSASINQNLFTVDDRFMVRSASDARNCIAGVRERGRTPHDCCSTFTLADSNRFQISNQSYTFGIRISNNNPRPYAFRAETTEFNVDQYQFASVNGDSFSLVNLESPGRSLFLMKFLIGIFQYYIST